MTIEIKEHSISGWKAFADSVDFTPDPMILRTGEVFLNGLSSSKALGIPDLEVWAAINENIGGLIDFFDLLVTHNHVPLIDYEDAFDINSIPKSLASFLGPKAVHISVGYEPYRLIKQGAFKALAKVDPAILAAFANELAELDSLRYDWRPKLDDYYGEETWFSKNPPRDETTIRATSFLLGGLIFSGIAQASGTDHYIQPKRSRFFLAITAAPWAGGGISYGSEQSIFKEALAGLGGSAVNARAIRSLPPVLPYLLAKAPTTARPSDVLQLALEFPQTTEGKRYCEAAALLQKDGVDAARTANTAKVAREEAARLLAPYSEEAERGAGISVEANVSLSGPELKISKDIELTAWLRFWWNGLTPFGRMRKTFRRMWLTADSYDNFSRRVRDVWSRS